MKRLLPALLSLILLTIEVKAQLKLKDAFPSLTFTSPIELLSPPDGTNRICVVSQNGIISIFSNSADIQTAQTFLNIGSRIKSGGEMGLLGLAFHPDYKNNGYFYVNYTRENPGLETVIARFKVSASNPNQADPASELVLLTFAQPYSNHNGGKIAFGPDGYLYIASGDGGSSGDPQNNAQNLGSLLGKVLRIGVNNTAAGLNYAIPADNPYAGNTQGFKPEIYAYGLRNPWKFNFDEATGNLWLADVGQGNREEIDLIVKGGNYGWRIKEGTTCYKPEDDCNKAGLIAPVYEYGRNAGVSITGGYVYRGQIPYLQGKYIYGDFSSRNIWALTYASNTATNETLLQAGGLISSFGEDQSKELYVCNYSNGKIYKFADDALQAQTITFAALADKRTTSEPFRLSATASSGLPVSFAVVAGPASISDNNLVTLTGKGAVTIRATQSGNNQYLAAPAVEQSFRVLDEQDLSNITNPANAATGISTAPQLTSKMVEGATRYFVEINTKEDFSGTALLDSSNTASLKPTRLLDTSTVYYTRVRTNLLPGVWGQTTSFKTAGNESLTYITSPAEGAADVPVQPQLQTKAVPGATQYTFELSTKPDFSENKVNATSATTTAPAFSSLDSNTIYYTRVQTDFLPGLWGRVVSFKTVTGAVTSLPEQVKKELGLSVFPNPATQVMYIQFKLTTPATVSLLITDLQGKPVKFSLNEKKYTAGKQIVNVDVSPLKSGFYLYQLKINSQVVTGKFQVIK